MRTYYTAVGNFRRKQNVEGGEYYEVFDIL